MLSKNSEARGAACCGVGSTGLLSSDRAAGVPGESLDHPVGSIAVSAHHCHVLRGADEGGQGLFSPSWRSAVAPS